MGYDITWAPELRIRNEFGLVKLNKDFDKLRKKNTGIDNLGISRISYDEVEFEEYSGRYHEEDWELLFSFLEPYLEEGSNVTFTGEDDAQWRQIFKNGKWSIEDATTIFGYEPFKEFMEHFKEKMPKELKKKLEDWHKGMKVLEAL